MSRAATGEMTVSLSQSLADPEWDAFLQGTDLGQYQQSSMWARYKAAEGWKPLRYLFLRDNRIAGGFQILCKETRFGRVGYVPKGPVLPGVGPAGRERAVDQMIRAAHDHGLRALIAQPPDDCAGISGILEGKWFLVNHLLKVIDSTLVIPLDNNFDSVFRRMNRETRRRIRQARESNLSIREGNEDDLPVFFGLMAATCSRQEAHRPKPSSPSLLLSLWEAFRPGGHIDIAFAAQNGRILAGVLCINFGNRVTLWKKGWSEAGGEFRPNDLLYEYAIRKAHRDRFALFDFGGLDPEIARALLSGNPLTESQKNSRDVFNLRFGGIPKLLPEAMIYLKSGTLRRAFRFIGNRLHKAPNIFR